MNKQTISLIILLILMSGCASLTSPRQSDYITVNGLKMYYEIRGQGQPLVLLHGGGSSIETSFGNIIDSLAKDYQVIAIEQQAHGHTPDMDRDLSFEQMADDTANLLKQLKIKKANFLGFSNGGNIALQVAIRHREMVRKMILASAFTRNDGLYPSVRESISKGSSPADMPSELRDEYLDIAPNPNDLGKLVRKQVALMSNFQDIPDETIRAVLAHTMIIIGDKDIVLPEHAIEMHRMISHSQLVILPGVHGAYIGEATSKNANKELPKYTVGLMKEFLNSPLPK